MEEVREQMGDAPVYLSFDIDGLDPSFAQGTGTPFRNSAGNADIAPRSTS